jgi:hypothetical protein
VAGILKKEETIMVTRKNTVVAFIAILITAWLMLFFTQVEAQTTDEQKRALIGEWEGVWLGLDAPHTLIIHEIDTANAKARCTFIPARGEMQQTLAVFIPGPNPKLSFKLEDKDFEFVLKDKVLEGTFHTTMATGHYVSNTIKMEKRVKK